MEPELLPEPLLADPEPLPDFLLPLPLPLPDPLFSELPDPLPLPLSSPLALAGAPSKAPWYSISSLRERLAFLPFSSFILIYPHGFTGALYALFSVTGDALPLFFEPDFDPLPDSDLLPEPLPLLDPLPDPDPDLEPEPLFFDPELELNAAH